MSAQNIVNEIVEAKIDNEIDSELQKMSDAELEKYIEERMYNDEINLELKNRHQ